MAISIRNRKVESLAREFARLCNTSMTNALEIALESSLSGAETEPERLRRFLSELSRECSSLPDLDTRSPEVILGYDEQGGFIHGA